MNANFNERISAMRVSGFSQRTNVVNRLLFFFKEARIIQMRQNVEIRSSHRPEKCPFAARIGAGFSPSAYGRNLRRVVSREFDRLRVPKTGYPPWPNAREHCPGVAQIDSVFRENLLSGSMNEDQLGPGRRLTSWRTRSSHSRRRQDLAE